MSGNRAANATALRLALALTFFNFVGANAMRVLVTLYALELGASALVVGLLGGLLYLFALLLSWPIGALADRRGARGLLIFAAACASVSLLSMYLWPTLPVFFAAAALNGLALAFYHVTLQQLVGVLSTPEDRAGNVANFSLAGAMTSFAGPLLAGIAIDGTGHRVACLIIAAVSVVPLLLPIVFRQHLPPAQPRAQQAVAAPMKIDRTLVQVLVLSGLVQLGYDLFQFYLPLHGHALGMSASAIGAVLAALAAASFIARLFLARLLERIRPNRLLLVAFLIGAACFAVVPLASGVLSLAFIAFVFGLGMGISIPLTLILMYESSAKGRAGQALGLRLSAINLVRMTGPMMFGAIGAATGLPWVFWILAGCMLAGGLLVRRPLGQPTG